MKNLELKEMEEISGGSCVGATIGAGVSGALALSVAGPWGMVAGWLTGSIGGLVGCALS